MNDLEQSRKIINETDKEIAQLFEKRMKAAEAIANFKKENALSIFDKKREDDIIKKNCEYIKDDVIRDYYVDFIKNTMAVSRAYQSRIINGMKIAYSGTVGAYAYIAAKKMFPDAELVAYSDFENAYKAVENSECDVAVLPLENSYAGDVGTVMDLMFSGTLYINQVVDVAITHNIMAIEGATLSTVKTVVSHPQALSQCSDYIKKHGYETVSYGNTALAAEYVKNKADITVGAIASEETANIFGLNVLEGNINSSRNNTTRFAAFSKSMNKPVFSAKGESGNFILVFTVRNEAGALAKTLDIIGAHGYNMRNLRSRPMKELLWNYYFYVELEGDIETEDGKDMLKQLSATCDRLKLVGTYRTEIGK